MKTDQVLLGLAAAAMILTLSSSCGFAQQDVKLYQSGSALTKLTRAMAAQARHVDGVLEEDSFLPEAISPNLKQGTAHDPQLLDPFKGHVLRLRIENHHALILVCQEQTALIEDASCTANIDRYSSLEGRTSPCEFTMKVAEFCK